MVKYIKESYKEFKDHVTWATWSKLQQDTIVVTISTIILSIFLYIVDTTFGEVLAKMFAFLK